ncbi:hypothetical protein EDD18DRAFT_1137180 [Armillaria luteobubalina]|uniref:Nuclear rim protein 1 n=1 Tax=Armillaria luteobubalina TaxID=153913 RepID=A0AA39QK19_9AGAR|nr:hypothetical protein EDD18DRAFT_1137180 [Armillaria luteobubalina]
MDFRRRLANQGNSNSPRSSGSLSTASPAPLSVTPRKARVSIGIHHSPASTPSISSSVPFDWEAARARRPAPYSTPQQNKFKKPRPSVLGTPRRALVRRKSLYEKITSLPSQIAFEIALFPHNVPLPAPRTSASIIGGLCHLFHLCVRVSQVRQVPDSDLGWEDMYREDEGVSWFDWTVPLTLLLIAGSLANSVYLFTRIRLYHLHQQPDPVSSPNARYVSAELDFEPLEPPSILSRFQAGLWAAFLAFWRFLLGITPKTTSGKRMSRVQQIDMWSPGDLEMLLFCIYSPVHALLWCATGSSNWMIMLLIMGAVGLQLNALTTSYKSLIKDKEIIAAEVMHEYNEGFVYPRVNPIRKDVATMTHQSEVVNVWED